MPDDDFLFPAFHVTHEYTRPDGVRESEALTPPVCDACFDRRVRWEVDCDEFYIEDVEFGSTGGWALCDVCADLTRDRDVHNLARRIAVSWAVARGSRRKSDPANAVLLVRAFFENIVGDVRPFG